MGFFGKVKSLKNTITGGAAKVYLDTAPITFGEEFELVIRVQIDDADLKINCVYLEVEGREEIEVPDVDVVYERDGGVERRTEVLRAEGVTTQLEMTVDEGQILRANGGYEWTVNVELPSNAPPVYRGNYCQHTYVARASLDCFGNDPDSGWVELNIR